jgi:hypothetical protein
MEHFTKCILQLYILIQPYSVHCTSTFILRSGWVLIGIRQSVEICWFGFGLSNSQRPGSDQTRWIVWTVESTILNLLYRHFSVNMSVDTGQPIYAIGKLVMDQSLGRVDTLYQKSDLCIPRYETARSCSQFLLSCICERFVYSRIKLPIWLQQKRQTDPGNI